MILKLNKKGTLLVEALLAVTILGVGLTVIIHAFLSSFRALSYSKDYSLATILLENKMYALLERGFIEEDLNEDTTFPPPYEKFRYHLETRNLKEKSEAGKINEVRLEIQWASGKKRNVIPVTTYLFNLPK